MADKKYFTPEQIEEFVERSRKAQGLPKYVTDPVVLAKIAVLLRDDKPPPAPRPYRDGFHRGHDDG